MLFSPSPVGIGQVIKGWDEGLVGMCVGEKRTLTIPSHMAYGLYSICPFVYTLCIDVRDSGERGFGSVIPANSALVFDVELVDLTPKSTHQEL